MKLALGKPLGFDLKAAGRFQSPLNRAMDWDFGYSVWQQFIGVSAHLKSLIHLTLYWGHQ